MIIVWIASVEGSNQVGESLAAGMLAQGAERTRSREVEGFGGIVRIWG